MVEAKLSPAELALEILQDPKKAVSLAAELIATYNKIAAKERELQDRVRELAYLEDTAAYIRDKEELLRRNQDEIDKSVEAARQLEQAAQEREAQARKDSLDAQAERESIQTDRSAQAVAHRDAMALVDARLDNINLCHGKLQHWMVRLRALADELATDLSKQL